MKKFLLTPIVMTLCTASLAFSPFRVQQVQINGVTENQKLAIYNIIGIHSGDFITNKDVDSVIKNLYSVGSFENILVKKVNNNLVVDVYLHPLIKAVNFSNSGSRIGSIPLDEVRKTYFSNNVRQGTYLNKDVVSSLNDSLVNAYKNMGYTQVEVKTNYVTNPDGTVTVNVVIDQHKRSYLDKLVLTGNKSFTIDQILDDSKIRPHQHWYNFYHTSDFGDVNKEQLLKNITSFYKDHGYAKFEILNSESQSNNKAEPQNIDFVVNINEGNIYHVSSSSFYTRDDKLDAELSKLNLLKDKSIFDQSLVNTTVQAVKNYLAGKGYARAIVSPIYNYGANNTVNITYAVQLGYRYTVGSIEFTGNFETKDSVIRRQLVQQENSVFNLNKINQDITSLMRTGYFTNVTYSTQPVEGSLDQLNLFYNLTKAKFGELKFGFGYSQATGPNVNLSFQQKNFLGTGRAAGATLSLSKGKTNASINFTEPFISTAGISLGSSIYYNHTDTAKLFGNQIDYSAQNQYEVTNFGASTNLSVPVSYYSNLNFGISYDYYKYVNLPKTYYRGLYLKSINQLDNAKNINATNGSELKKWVVTTKDVSLNLSWTYNSYNRYLFPTSGTRFNIGTNVTSFLSTDKYASFSTQFRNLLPLNDAQTWVFSTRFAARHVVSFKDHYVPMSSLYSAGGFNSLRGFAPGSIGPATIIPKYANSNFNDPKQWTVVDSVLGGNTYVNGGIDLIFPLFRGDVANTVRTSFFIDAASAWSTNWNKYTAAIKPATGYFPDYSKPEFKAAAGISLEWQSPLGLLSFSVARPIIYHKADKPNFQYFSINFGQSF